MIKFNENELEVAIVTYNRPEYIERILELYYDEFLLRNIKIKIYDSSTNKLTKNLINKNWDNKIEYYSVDSNVDIGHKPMIAILNSTSKFIWVCSDARCHDINELDNTVFKSIKENIDYILISAGYSNEYNNFIFENKRKFIEKCFISTTCIGLSIYKTEIFNELKYNKDLFNKLNNKFKNNFAFEWLGYFFEVFSLKKYAAKYHSISIFPVINKNKIQSWTNRFYECWIENLINIADNIPIEYDSKNIPRIVWDNMKLYSINHIYIARKNNGLNKSILNKYLNNGMLDRVTDKKIRFIILTYLPIYVVSLINFIVSFFLKFKKIFF